MTNGTQGTSNPTDGAWKRFLLMVPLVIVLGVGSFFHIRSKAGSYTAYGTVPREESELGEGEVAFTNPGVVELESVGASYYGTVLVRFRALSDGKTEVSFTAGERSDTWTLEVRNGSIIEGGINFEGWEAVRTSYLVCLGMAVVLFASIFVRLWRTSWYDYTMVASGGGFLFCLFQLVLSLVFVIFEPEPTFAHYLISFVAMTSYFDALSFPLMLLLAVLVSLSNVVLIRHEGRRPVNLLGIAASVVWVAAMFLWTFLSTSLFPMRSSIMLARCLDTLMAVAIAFGEFLLISTMICAWLASVHTPKRAMDYLVVLGCGIRADGTPCPLLAGRVDRAASFDATRVEAGDAPAVFVPSGGQGPDEPTSEAQSMGAYLESTWGVGPERIVLEDRSTTTRENMTFSREVIERHAGRDVSELRVGFSTTNYHVFRGYVCAHQAGMAVEGMGSKTKYYFWPNAFLREFAGLLINQWRSILLVYVAIVVLYLFAVFALGIG